MVVNSIPFLVFFVIVFIVYYLPFIKKYPKIQNLWLFITSYYFYAYVDWKMVALLLGTTIVFFFIGKWIGRSIDREHWKKASGITALGVVLGVGILFYFKYLGFFVEQAGVFLSNIGFKVSYNALNIIMPLGVSFFTFKLISYVIEIHREKISPSTDFIEFGVYIAFFATILSGPIDRANTFIPQLRRPRTFDAPLAEDGCRQILWGMFTKMCVADVLAPINDGIWDHIHEFSPSTLIIGLLLYPVQLYADFDGYSNMAIGVGKLLGLRIQKNFNNPFLARNTAEYWRRWHISLTTWLSDYVFSPLNIKFRELGKLGICLAAIINLILVGFWHGANWTYGVFGLYHGLLFIPLIYSGAFMRSPKLKANKYNLPYFKEFLMMCGTYCLVTIGLLIFRAPDITMVGDYISAIFNDGLLNIQNPLVELRNNDFFMFNMRTLAFIPLIFIVEWFTRNNEYGLQIKKESLLSRRPVVRFGLYYVITLSIVIFGGEATQFVYFQF